MQDCRFCGADDSVRVKNDPALVAIGDRPDRETRQMMFALFCKNCRATFMLDSGQVYSPDSDLLSRLSDEEQMGVEG